MNSTWNNPIKPDDWTPSFATAHGGSGIYYTAPNGRKFRVYRMGFGSIEAFAPDDPFNNYWTPAIPGAWEAMRQSIDFNNPVGT